MTNDERYIIDGLEMREVFPFERIQTNILLNLEKINPRFFTTYDYCFFFSIRMSE